MIINETVPQRIADDIIRQMKKRALQNGERLREETYVKMYGVSQTVVRESFFILESKDLVHRIPRKGTYLSLPQKEEMPKIMKIREINEVFINREFALTRTSSDLAIIEDILINAEKELERRDYVRYYDYGQLFHSKVYSLIGYNKLRKLYESIQDTIDIYYVNTPNEAEFYEDNLREAHDHRALYSAFVQKDPDKAEEITRIHLNNVINRLERYGT
jgi:DNA-binding GntR family transcriptional regulator